MMKELPSEGRQIFEIVRNRINKKLGVTILITGLPGKGKSFIGLRFMELWYDYHFGELFPVTHVCETLEQAILLVKDFKRPGEAIQVEELSVLAGRRDSLSSENKLWNKFMDTVRMKQTIIIGNCPHLTFVDKHFVLLSDFWMEAMGVNFREKRSYCKCLFIQTTQHKRDPYMHRLIDDDGMPIDYFRFSKPSDELVKDFLELEKGNKNKIYEELAQKIIAKKEKEKKSIENLPRFTVKEAQALRYKIEGLKGPEAAEKMDIAKSSYYFLLEQVKKKLDKLYKGKIPKEIPEIPLESI